MRLRIYAKRCGGATPKRRRRAAAEASSRAEATPQARASGPRCTRAPSSRSSLTRPPWQAYGCGNPTAVADLHDGEIVLDLGSGGGIDVILSPTRVGSRGFAYGLDMTDEMLDLGRQNASDVGVENVRFLKGVIEDVPLADGSVDVAISNCVINLSVDMPAVFAELERVLRPGGGIGISDVVAEDRLSPEERAARGSFVGCIAGALSKSEYERELQGSGFADVSATFTHEVADGLHGAIVRARKPAH